MPARLPERFIEKPKRIVTDLKEGESGLIEARSLTLHEDGTLWVWKQSQLYSVEAADCPSNTVRLTKNENALHADLSAIAPNMTYRPEPMLKAAPDHFLPIESIRAPA